jgi:hypothetical protein
MRSAGPAVKVRCFWSEAAKENLGDNLFLKIGK